MSKRLIPGFEKPVLHENGRLEVDGLRISSPSELIISSGIIIIGGKGFYTVDTEGNAYTDNLDVINGGVTGDTVILKAAHTDRTIIVRHGNGNIRLRENEAFHSVHFASPSGAAGIFYTAGFYDAPAAEAALTQASLTVTHGAANISYAAHVFLVAKGDGAKTGGDLVLKVTGTSIDDQGNRTATDSETIVADALLATFATDNYVETTKKWLGQVTITLSSTGGGNFNCSFNYGFVKYNDFGNRKFHITDFECVGRAGANDTGFDIKLFHHSSSGWTYHASAFVTGGTVLADMNADHSTEQNLNNGDYFAYKRDNLNAHIDGVGSEGVIVEITTGANRAVETMDIIFGGHERPSHVRLDDTEQGISLVYDGGNWLEL